MLIPVSALFPDTYVHLLCNYTVQSYTEWELQPDTLDFHTFFVSFYRNLEISERFRFMSVRG